MEKMYLYNPQSNIIHIKGFCVSSLNRTIQHFSEYKTLEEAMSKSDGKAKMCKTCAAKEKIETKRIEEENRRKEEEQRRAEEERKRIEEEQRREEEEQRRVEEERKRIEEEQRRAEEERRRAEEERKRIEEEQQRKEEAFIRQIQEKRRHAYEMWTRISTVLFTISMIILMIVLIQSCGSGSGSGSSSYSETCKSCGRTFTDSTNMRSIARTGMCSNCYNNFKWGQAATGKGTAFHQDCEFDEHECVFLSCFDEMADTSTFCSNRSDPKIFIFKFRQGAHHSLPV